jgi:MFS superfamily sulfate permease-like transporter
MVDESMEQFENERIQRLVIEELAKAKAEEKTNWKRFTELCHKYFAVVLVLNIMLNVYYYGIEQLITILLGLAIISAILFCIVWFFKVKDSKGNVDSVRATYEIISVFYISLLIVSFIIGFIYGFILSISNGDTSGLSNTRLSL